MAWPEILYMQLLLGCLLQPHSLATKDLAQLPLQEDLRVSRGYRRICPLQPCSDCPSIPQIRAPGIGFALEMGYGTVAVRHHDGTYKNIAMVEADAAYTTLMRDLALGPVVRNPEPETAVEKIAYLRRRAQRLANKTLGRPATPATGVMAHMVGSLKSDVEEYLEMPITAAALGAPDRIKLTEEEITDILDYLKVKTLMTEWWSDSTYASSTAYAGFGEGLCSNYTDWNACQTEEYRLPSFVMLHLDFSAASLSATIKRVERASQPIYEKVFIDPDLGLDAEHKYVRTDNYWTAVGARVRILVQSQCLRITKLMLTGTEASNRRFQASIRNALQDVVAEGSLAVLDKVTDAEDQQDDLVVWATARGAAEFAKRRQEGPLNCRESAACKRRRKDEKEGSGGLNARSSKQGPLPNAL